MNDKIRLFSNERYCLVIPSQTCYDCRDLLSIGDRMKCEKLNVNDIILTLIPELLSGLRLTLEKRGSGLDRIKVKSCGLGTTFEWISSLQYPPFNASLKF